MILLEKPYVSDFLKDTIEKLAIPVIKTEYSQEQLKNRNVVFVTPEEVKEKFRQNNTTPLYTNSENSISWIEQNLDFTPLYKNIKLFKNKYAFREILKPVFPDYFFKKVLLSELDNMDIERLPFPFIIKPTIGFFSIGVQRVDSASEWPQVVQTIKEQIEASKNDYPLEVVDVNEFIIEQLIDGDEYAVDTYYNEIGKPVIVGIMKHTFSSGKDMSDRIYMTSKAIFDEIYDKIYEFVKIVGELIDLKNFPFHLEFRYNSEGVIIPIEVNPMRFGGWCTTADTTWFSYGLNPYEQFFMQKTPDWKEILKNKDGFVYSMILLDNNSGINGKDIISFDYEKLESDFVNPLCVRKTNYKEYPVFGFVFAETPENNTVELDRILRSNLREYIKQK